MTVKASEEQSEGAYSLIEIRAVQISGLTDLGVQVIL
jgi:hypothetical protein